MILQTERTEKLSKTLNAFLNMLQEEWKSGRDGKRLASVSIHPILAEDIEKEGGVIPKTFGPTKDIPIAIPIEVKRQLCLIDWHYQ